MKEVHRFLHGEATENNPLYDPKDKEESFEEEQVNQRKLSAQHSNSFESEHSFTKQKHSRHSLSEHESSLKRI